MQKMRTPGDRAGRQTRRRSAVWLVPHPTTSTSTHGPTEESLVVGALALDGMVDATRNLAPGCVVIVEDAPHTVRLLLRALMPVAGSALTVIDASQPGADGADVYRQVRATPPTCASHVIFITNATALDLSARGVDSGVVLRVPFEVEQVVALVNELINTH